MYIASNWTSRPMSPEQTNRMMEAWGKVEAGLAENPSINRVCWFISADGATGFTVSEVTDADAAAAFQLEISLVLGEFFEFETKVVLDMDQAMGPIEKAVASVNS